MNEKEFLEGVGAVCESASKLAALALRSPNFADQNVGNAVDFGLLNNISCEQIDRLRNLDDGKKRKPDWLSLPWISEESVDCFDDGQKMLVAIRVDCEWQYEIVVAVHDAEGITSFEFRDGRDFDWEDVRYLIPLNDLECTLPAISRSL